MSDLRYFVDFRRIPGQTRRVVLLRGADVIRFLQGVVSNDVAGLASGRAVAASVLTVKAQLVTEVVILPDLDGGTGLLVPDAEADALVELLDRHIIMDDVQVEVRSDLGCGLVWPSQPWRTAEAQGISVFETRHPAPGDLVVGQQDAIDALHGRFEPAGEEEFLRHRVETASPGWGHELTAGRLPPEMGFVYGVSYDKGCFMGQEPLARVHARGQVNRVMVRLRGEEVPSERAILSTSERPRAGEWTTWVRQGGGVVGLGLVHRSLAVPGTPLATPEGLAVEVTSGPLGDDPGMRARSSA